MIRALCYTVAAAACRLAAYQYFGDSPSVFLSLFVLVALVGEYSLPAVLTPRGAGPGPGVGNCRFDWRTLAFVGVTILLLAGGSALVSSGAALSAAPPDVIFGEKR